jgi:alkyldihydroxyacetonephosphate synthase
MKFALDRESLLVRAPGEARMKELLRFLQTEGVHLPLETDPPDVRVAAWLAGGAPGARGRFVDPADQLVAGATIRLKSGALIELRPAPRRSVGPDLFALVFGQGERFATVVHADLRVLFPDTAYESAPFRASDPPLEEGERRLFEAIEAQISPRR